MGRYYLKIEEKNVKLSISKNLQPPVNCKFQLLDFANVGYIFNYDNLIKYTWQLQPEKYIIPQHWNIPMLGGLLV
jgi:hypothetical protein